VIVGKRADVGRVIASGRTPAARSRCHGNRPTACTLDQVGVEWSWRPRRCSSVTAARAASSRGSIWICRSISEAIAQPLRNLLNTALYPLTRSPTLSPQKRHQRALRAPRIRSRALTSDLCENARARLEAPATRRTPQIQAPKLRTQIVVSPPLLTALPHPSWWGTWGGSPFSPLGEHPKSAGVNDLWPPSGRNGTYSQQRSMLS